MESPGPRPNDGGNEVALNDSEGGYSASELEPPGPEKLVVVAEDVPGGVTEGP